jgi:phasin family protein
MTIGKAPQFEIPADMRKMTEQSMEQVKTAISAYLDFCKRSVPANVLGGSALSNKIFGYAEGNLAKAFEFVERLAQVRDPQEFTKLQMDFVQDQMQGMTEQAKELGEAATKAMLDSAKPTTKGGLSS